MTEIQTEHYVNNAKIALNDTVMRKALAGLQERLGPATAQTYINLPEGPELRLKAQQIRMESIEHLDILLAGLAEKIRGRGGKVFFAKTAQDAVDYCLEVASRNGVKTVIKGKSMVTEEIGLNPALENKDIEATETDLGEYIIQLAGESPSHIIAPAIHKTRKEVGKLFEEKLGIEYSEDPPTLTWAARKALREKFIAADMGLSGCNLACAETGHITTVSNEGNIRMSTTMPKIHMAFMGMERVIARLEDHDILFRLLSRGAAAQNLAGYVSYIGGPRSPEQSDGPDEFHLVIIDNGRSKILADPEFREVLTCIRCAACLNVCPVYGNIGGHTYGYPYSGPIGAVVTPLMVGINRAKDLCKGESLCGACRQACPVNNNLPRMLLALRRKLAEGDPEWNVTQTGGKEKLTFRLWAQLIKNRRVYEIILKMGTLLQTFFPRHNGMIRNMPGFNGWTVSRDVKPLAKQTFMEKWRKGGMTK